MLDLTPRETVRRYLSSNNPDNTETATTNVSDYIRGFEGINRVDLEEILLEEMEAACPLEQLLAASLILEIPRHGPNVTEAIRKFEATLASSDDKRVVFAAHILSGLQELPSELVSQIEGLFTHDSSEIRLISAAIGLHVADLQETAESILLTQVDDLTPVDRFTVAIAMIRSGKHARRGWVTVEELATGKSSEDFFNHVLNCLGWVGESRHTSQKLLSVLDNDSIPLETQVMAIRLLGFAERNSVTVRETLLGYLASREWQFVYVAADALRQQTPPAADEAMPILMDHLENSDVPLREAAATVLRKCFFPPSKATVEQVVERMVFERDLEVLSQLTSFCVASGGVVVGPLLDAIEQTTGMRKVVLYSILPQLGESAAEPLIEAMANATSDTRKGLLAGLLANMQISQASLVDSLKQMLTSPDANECRLALTAIANIGREAEFLTPEILKAIDTWDVAIIQNLGMNAIESVGPAAIAYLDSFSTSNSSLIEHIRGRLESQGRTRGDHELSWIENTKLLRVYVLVAELLDEKPASYPVLARILEERQINGEVAEDLGLSERNLNVSINKLEADLSDRWARDVALLTYGKRKWTLTYEGRKVLRLAKSLLEATA